MIICECKENSVLVQALSDHQQIFIQKSVSEFLHCPQNENLSIPNCPEKSHKKYDNRYVIKLMNYSSQFSKRT
jgi:hypothetical protein